MKRTETAHAMRGLSEEQRRRVLKIAAQIKALESELKAIMGESESQQGIVDLPSRSIDQTQAAVLRARLKTFAEDWERPETAIYDQASSR